MDRFNSAIIRLDSNVWDRCFLVPDTVANKLMTDGSKRVLCSINGGKAFHAAIMASKQGFFINVNKEVRKQHNIDIGSDISVELEKDTSKYGMELPDELKAAWDLDPEGKAIFHELTPGKQRNLIHLVGKPKSSEIRIKKALVILNYLKSVNGQLDFKELNEAFKQANK